jgi:hypothetical protein
MLQCRDAGIDGFGRHFLVFGEMDQILMYRVAVELPGTPVEISGIPGDVMDVTSLCGGREATHFHVLDELLS